MSELIKRDIQLKKIAEQSARVAQLGLAQMTPNEKDIAFLLRELKQAREQAEGLIDSCESGRYINLPWERREL